MGSLFRTRSLAVVAALVFAPFAVAEDAEGDRRFENDPGWAWIIEPFSWEDDARNPQMLGSQGAILLFAEGKNQELNVAVAHGTPPGHEFQKWRPVAFDRRGARHELRPCEAHGNAVPNKGYGVFMERWGSDPKVLPSTEVAAVGLEGLTAEGFRQIADEAAREAQRRSLATLPLPIVGQPYEFTLTDIDGETIDSRDLRGKVVLLDFWATWCFPCMEKMPMLKEVYEKHNAAGFEVVGLNLDEDREACRKAAERLRLPWRQALAPPPGADRDLWMKATGLQGIPRLLLIDAEGVLRADCTAPELEEQLTGLLQSSDEN